MRVLLARAGIDVLVLEQSGKPGGGSRTEETIPGYRFDTHSVAHNIINMTSIPRELGLRATGLQYREMDPFAIAVFADGRRVRFHRSVERTVASIARLDPAEARAYAAFMRDAIPLVDLLTLGVRAGGGSRELTGRILRRLPQAGRLVRGGGALRLASELAGSYGRLLEDRLGSDLTRAPVSAFAAHAGASPEQAGGALFGFWQAHRAAGAHGSPARGAGRSRPRRGAPDQQRPDGRARRRRPAPGVHGCAARRSPRPAELRRRARRADGRVPRGRGSPRALPAPAYAFTTSALDSALAPPGRHTVYLACPAAPFDDREGWERAAAAVVRSMLDQVEARAPGFQDTIQGVAVRTPELMASELRWRGAHPMVLDVTLDQVGALRPTAALASHRTPVEGMYISGAGTAPTGGVAGLPGRGAAHAVIRDQRAG